MANQHILQTQLLRPEDIALIVQRKGFKHVMEQMVHYIKEDYLRWDQFKKTARHPIFIPEGVLELMPIADDSHYSFKYVNCHPNNPSMGLSSVLAFGALIENKTGAPNLLSELTITTAIRTAAMSVLAASYLARKNSQCMAVIGNGSQSEFQCLAFHHIMGIKQFRLYDIDAAASKKLAANLHAQGLDVLICDNVAQACEGADIITTITADYTNAHIIQSDMVKAGMHLNAVGGDSPGKTELDPAILHRAKVFVEFEPQTRVEGEIQNVAADFAVTALVDVFKRGLFARQSNDDITVFDSVGFALEDFSALRLMRDLAYECGLDCGISLVPSLADPKDLFSALQLQKVQAVA